MLNLAVLLSVLLLDQISKFFVLRYLELGESRPVLDGMLHLTRHANTGAAFGILSRDTPFLAALSLCFIAFMSYYLLSGKGTRAGRLAFVLILAGAIGNAIDRLRFGHVVDFIDVRVWPIFNVAHSPITAGFTMVLFALLSQWRLKK